MFVYHYIHANKNMILFHNKFCWGSCSSSNFQTLTWRLAMVYSKYSILLHGVEGNKWKTILHPFFYMLVKVPVSCNGSWGKDVLFSFSIPVFYQWGVFICGSAYFGGLFFFLWVNETSLLIGSMHRRTKLAFHSRETLNSVSHLYLGMAVIIESLMARCYHRWDSLKGSLDRKFFFYIYQYHYQLSKDRDRIKH